MDESHNIVSYSHEDENSESVKIEHGEAGGDGSLRDVEDKLGVEA